ncbi:aldehyde dehydrogenase family protein [Dactylosporangium sp. NPDC049742]|uniref:aldehyde dehydrogenase family protein n=1 Tax=Dactylosporangium sp. NPDC049742 TaxID=3154737 RepID=UPI00341AB583
MNFVDLPDPRTGHIRSRLDCGGPAEVSAAVAAARAALPAWAGLTAKERSHRLLALVALIEQHLDAYVAAEVAGTGKPASDARAEVLNAADVLRFYAGAVRADLTPAAGHRLPGRESWVRWEPLGVVAAIVPWNYPLLMAAWRLGPALAAGNAVVLKPAETTPDTAVLLASHAASTLGAGVLVALPGDRDTGRLLVGADVDAVAFTGSQAGGLDVVARAGLRRVSLELGGNCAAVVLPDAPPFTYDELVGACTYNAGQSCAAPARVITLRSHLDEVVDGLAAAMLARRAGPDFGPLNNAAQLARFDAIVSSSAAGVRRSGALAVGSGEADGFWRAGLILADLPPDDPAVTQEMFGPALTVQAADDLDGVVALANSVPQALAASVWGTAVGPSLRVAGLLDCGEVWVNCHLEQTAELPHGGRRGSGHGTDLSVLALAEYQRPKTVTVRL